MSNPYTQPSLTGYNASPPTDDSAATTDNQVSWAKHKTKLADPIKTFSEAVDSAAHTAFGLTFGAATRPLTADYTVTTTDRGRFITATNLITITLLDAATAGVGFPILIQNIGTEVVTVDGNAAETINGNLTLSLGPQMSVVLTCDGNNWVGQVAIGYDTGTFTTDWTGFSTSETTTWEYTRTGRLVTMRPQAELSATSNSTLLTSQALAIPSQVRPSQQVIVAYIVRNNGTLQLGRLRLESSGLLIADSDVTGAVFTASGAKGLLVQEVSYQLEN